MDEYVVYNHSSGKFISTKPKVEGNHTFTKNLESAKKFGGHKAAMEYIRAEGLSERCLTFSHDFANSVSFRRLNEPIINKRKYYNG
jgi:hypothetical protein